jgi:hypothetical protein
MVGLWVLWCWQLREDGKARSELNELGTFIEDCLQGRNMNDKQVYSLYPGTN